MGIKVSKRYLLTLLLCLAILSGPARGQRFRRIEKSVIKYLGTDYLLRDGCPAPICDKKLAECQRTLNMIRALYSHCTQSIEGQYIGCITERINNKETITLPVYANKCSAMCYESLPENLAKVHRCPFPGYRQHNPDHQGLFE